MIYWFRASLQDKLMLREEKYEISKETEKTLLIFNNLRSKTIKKNNLGVVMSGALYGSFECFCEEKQIESIKHQLKCEIISYYSQQYCVAKKNMEKLVQSGAILNF